MLVASADATHCGTEWKRQQVYASVTAGTGGGTGPHTIDEKMPIVEIRPFTKERSEWCRARSLPEFYNNPEITNISAKNAANGKTNDSKDARTASGAFTPRSPSFASKLPSPRIQKSAYPDRSISEQSMTFCFPPKTAMSRDLTMMEGRISAWSEIPTPLPTPRPGVSFLATPREREWYTKEDLRNGVPNVCNMQFGTTVSKPEEHYAPKPLLKIKGCNFSGPGKYFQLNARNYSLYKEYTAQMEQRDRERDYVYKRMMSDSRKNSDEIYKLDGNKTPQFPFFNVRRARKKTGRKSRMGTADHPSRSQCSTAAGYRVGTIKNSLELLSEMGTPLKIEKQISDDLNTTMSQIRKSNYSCFTPPPSLASQAHFRLSTAMPTQGEIMLAEARYANSISTRKSLRRPITQASNYSQKTGRTTIRPPSPRASLATMSQYKSEHPDRDSGIQSPVEGAPAEQKPEALALIHRELKKKLTIEDEGHKFKKQRAGSAPAVIEQLREPPRVPSAKTEDEEKSQTSQSRHVYFPSRGDSPLKEASLLHPETPSLVIQTPVIPEETSDNEESC